MSTRPRQHWQEDGKDYKFSHYAFYLVVLGLLIAGLLVWYLSTLRPPPISITHLVSIVSQPGGQLPVIPFQNEDSAALESKFQHYDRYDFDDMASFKQDVIEKLKTECLENQSIDSVIIWLSAIGDVRDGKPVILGSEPGEEIELSFLIEQLNDLKAEQVLLLLDCGHAYVGPEAYVNKSLDTDFNSFADTVVDKIETGGKVHVLLHAFSGERPMYSTTRRRSLFGLALETMFVQSNAVDWTTGKLRSDLNELCLKLGGTSAPNLRWLGNQPGDIAFLRPRVIESDDDPDEEEDEQDPDLIEFAPAAKQIAEEMNKTWAAVRKTRKKFVVPPGTVDPAAWQTLTHRLIGFAADELQSTATLQEFTRACRKVASDLPDLEDSLRDKTERTVRRLSLVADPAVESEPETVIEKRTVADAFLRVNDLDQRLPHYVAIVDSLSWILPTDDAVEKLRTNTIQLIELFGETNSASEAASVLKQLEPSLDRFDDIGNATDRIRRSEDRLLKRLNFICRNVIPQTDGFQREMAIEAVLRLPFLEVEKPEAVSEEIKDDDRLWSREELQELLATNPANTYSRIEASDRASASARRIEVYRKFIAEIGEPANDNTISVRLQSFAYRLPVSNFEIEKFVVRNRTPKIRVRANRQNDLVNSENYVERIPTELDLGLDVENTEVLVRCEIIQNAKYFGFPNAESDKFDFTGNPTLIALQDAIANDPQCKLNVSIVDKLQPTKEYDNFNIPIRLPSKNLIELVVRVGGEESVFKKDSLSDPIRPFANRKDLPCNFSLRNNWHRNRTGTISLYPCANPDSVTITGKINNEVMTKTIRLLETGMLPTIATAGFDLAGASTDKPAEPIGITWQKPPGDEGESLRVSADHGFLVVVKPEGENDSWNYWVPVFPFEKPVVAIDAPPVISDDVALSVNRKPFCPAEMPIRISWRFTGDQINGGKELLGAGKNTLQIPIAKNVAQNLKSGSFLYVDVDDWPRKFVFEFNGRQFRIASPNDAEVSVRLGGKDDPLPETPDLVELSSDSDLIRFGTASEKERVTVNLSPNVASVGGAFLFSTAEDYISLFESGHDNQKLFYPRQINNFVQLAPKTGAIVLESRVSDYELTFDVVGPRFTMRPTLYLDRRSRELRGKNQIEIQFDRADPEITEVRVANSSSIYGKQPVRIRVDANDGEGVGIDWNSSVEIFLSERNGRLRELGKPYPAKRVGIEGSFEIEAPEEPGTYTVGARVTDLVGNSDEEISDNRVFFEVVKKPVVETKKPEPVVPIVFKHTLIVSLNADDLSNLTEPEVSLDPPDAPAELQGGKYIFKDLNGDVQYTVSAKATIQRGVAKGDELSAKLIYKFPKDSPGKLIISKSMKLKR